MESIDITFRNLTGRMIHTSLPLNFTMPDFINLIRDKLGAVNEFRFIMRGGELKLEDESQWPRQKSWITNDCVIHVIRELVGGCFLADTLVMRADKSVVPINTIQVGDDLLSFSNSGEIVTTTVQETFIRHVDDYIELKVG